MHRAIFGALSLLACAASLPALAQTPAPASAAPVNARDREVAAYTFAFQDAEISQAAQEVFGALGVAYTLDPSATGRISFRIDQRLTRLQLLQAFESALAANDIALVRNGEVLVVTKTSRARASAGVRVSGDGARRAGYEVVAIPLAYISASEAKKALEAVRGADSVIYASDSLGLIVLGGSGDELASVTETLKVFDQSALQNSRIRWFELSQTSATSVARDLEEMLRAAGVVGVSVAPLRRLNGIMLFGRTQQVLDEVGQWVTRLDAPGREASSSLYVYRPRNTSAEALARTLGAVVSGQVAVETFSSPGSASASPSSASTSTANVVSAASGGEDAVRVSVDPGTNTLLISAPMWRWIQLQRALAEIDRPQSQILIEASILEVTLTNEFRFGVDWSLLDNRGRLGASLVNNTAGTVRPAFPGFSLTYLGNDIQAAVNALGEKTTIEVISAPKIVALDNHAAHLQVGDQVPVVTQTSQATQGSDSPLVSSVDYRNSGVILTVTPRISGENKVVLEVAQEVSSVVRTNTSGIDSPTIQQRKLESTLILANGGVVALGGLISGTRNNGDSGIPGLKDVPGIGHLFKSSSGSNHRTELIVLLSAKILTDGTGSTQAIEDLLADMKEIRGRGLVDAAQ